MSDPRRRKEPWRVGIESPRESRRFRFPVCGDEQEWPWVALFEQQKDAEEAVLRFNAYPELTQENVDLRRRIVALEQELGAALEPVEVSS